MGEIGEHKKECRLGKIGKIENLAFFSSISVVCSFGGFICWFSCATSFLSSGDCSVLCSDLSTLMLVLKLVLFAMLSFT